MKGTTRIEEELLQINRYIVVSTRNPVLHNRRDDSSLDTLL